MANRLFALKRVRGDAKRVNIVRDVMSTHKNDDKCVRHAWRFWHVHIPHYSVQWAADCFGLWDGLATKPFSYIRESRIARDSIA